MLEDMMFNNMSCSRKALGRYFIPLKVEPMFGHLGRGFSMAEPVNHTLHVLREFREEFREFAEKTDKRFDTLEKKVDRNHEELKQRIENLRQAAFGESFLGRYAAAEVEEGFPPSRAAFLPLSSRDDDLRRVHVLQLNATLTDDSGNS
jgi:hypothetical protein